LGIKNRETFIFIKKRNMSKYDSLFEKGYYFGDTSEMSFDMDEYNKKCKEIFTYLDDKEKYFEYFNIAPDLPHRIPYTEREDRLNFLKTKPNIDPFNSANNLVHTDETRKYMYYFRDQIMKFIPNIYPDLDVNTLTMNPGIQMYQDGDFQQAHFDGHIGLCVVILYFSDPSNYNYTGRLEILESRYSDTVIDKIDPIDGKFAIFDTVHNNVKHRVEKVTGDFKRFSFLGQIAKLTDVNK
jgi:Rps23 Pro-64 3,4-dihydroxylase Tpa1-like proline 4-hydroxylase